MQTRKHAYSSEVHRKALFSPVGALQKHVVDVMACAIVKVSHVERLGPEVSKVRLLLEGSQHFGLGQVRVGDLVVLIEECQQLAHVEEVIPGDLGKAELVEVAEGDCRESEVGCRHLIQLGDVGVLKVVLHTVHADKQQQSQWAHERQSPQEAAESHVPVGKDVAHAMQGGCVGKGLQVGGPDALYAFLRVSLHGCHWSSQPHRLW